jgi:uncharacterized membrane protein
MSTIVESVTVNRVRLESIDIVRGVIMVLMALDHERYFFGVPGVSPTDLDQATKALFFTRWITHFCAPVFFVLTGTGAYLSVATQNIQTRVIAISFHWRPVADLSRSGGDPPFRLAT